MDVYSYSMILYQLFEDHMPFAGMDPVEAARQVKMQSVAPKGYSSNSTCCTNFVTSFIFCTNKQLQR